MPTISFSGLASGIDSSSLISQLVALEKRPAQLLTSQQSDLSTKKVIVTNLTSALGSLGDLVGGMALDTDLQFRTASTSDAHVSVAASGSALAANHDVRVEQLARAQVASSRTFTTDAAGVLGVGSVTIGGSATVSWDATDTLESIASKINDNKAGVTASVLNDGTTYRLIVSSTKTGTANAATFTDAGDGLALSDPANVKIAAQDAKMSVDGVTVTRPTNVFDDVLAGVTLTAVSPQAAGDADTAVTVDVDHDAITKKLQTLVSKFNGIVGGLHEQLDYTGTTKGSNTLFGDSTLQQLQSAMMGFATQQFGGASLSDLGITIDKTGAMSLDSDKLDTAIAADPNAVSNLFVGGGLSKAISTLVDGYTRPGDGMLVLEAQGFTDQSTTLQDQIDTINASGDALQQRLSDQFSALEATMSKLQSQSSYIAKLLAA